MTRYLEARRELLSDVESDLADVVAPYAFVDGGLPDDVLPTYRQLVAMRATLLRSIARSERRLACART